MLADGAVRYGTDRGVMLKAWVLEISEDTSKRPSTDEVLEFLTNAFSNDLPVAFLNLSNGTVKNLDNWHWVTLISTDSELQVEMYDQSRRQLVDLKQWLVSTTKGGALVVIEPQTLIYKAK